MVNTTNRLGIERTAQGSPEHTDPSVPMSTSSLVKKWALSTKSSPDADVAAEKTVHRVTQDDTWTEKLFADQDLSDPGYCSETGSTNPRASSSFHRLGHRPGLATRTYVMQDLSFVLDQTVGMLLNRLQRFTDQQKSVLFKTSDEAQSRRFVIGLKEVVRRVKQCKVECLIVAPDIEEDANSGGLDDRMRELLASAYQNHTPVIFALSRARLGSALGKSLHISVFGVLDARGAKGLLAESVQLASRGRQAWLARIEK